MVRIITICALFIISASTFGQTDSNLLLFYPFDGNVLDNSGNEYHGTPFGITYTEDRSGTPNSAAFFDGLDDFIEFPNTAELKPVLPVSFAFWVKYNTGLFTQQAVFNTSLEAAEASGVVFNSSGATGGYAINFADGSPFYSSDSRRTFTTFKDVITDQWLLVIVVVRSATDMTIFVNCEITEGFYSGTGGDLAYSDQPGTIGKHVRNIGVPFEYFAGAIDDFMYWDKALSENDIGNLCSGLSTSDFSNNLEEIKLFPNPARSTLFVSTGAEIQRVEIFDTAGRKLHTAPYSKAIDISYLNAGIYLVRFSKGKQSKVLKIVVQ